MIVTNNMGLPKPFVDAAYREHSYVAKRYSVTQLLKGVRQSILERRHQGEVVQDASDLVWAIFGTAVHSILEKSEETSSQIKECKLVVDMHNGYQLSGIFDLYDDETGTVTDYKTASCWKFVKRDFDDWRKQTLIYAWMLRKTGFDAKRGQIVALLKDHSKLKSRTERDYPKHPVATVCWDFSDRDFDLAETWLRNRFEAIARCEHLHDDELPRCTPEERWATPDQWAVKKKGNKRAAKLHLSEHDAVEDAARRALKDGCGYEVEFRPGRSARCEDYCPVSKHCNQYMEG